MPEGAQMTEDEYMLAAIEEARAAVVEALRVLIRGLREEDD